jgi:cellulose synthase/poly-beta-1,6-N-acetylglucosamine synthase-like glycosyltransferase/putative flippase GtrA
METTQHLSGLHRARGVRFGLVGLSGVLVNSAVLWLLAVVLDLPVIVASLLATEAAVLSNFLLNDSWTFRSRSHRHAFGRRLLRYHGVAAGGAVVSLGVLAALTTHSGLPLLVANLFAIAAATLWNYAVNARWTWPQATGRPSALSRLDPRVRRAAAAVFVAVAALGGLSLAARVAGGWVAGLVLVASLALFAQALFSLFMMLYSWEQPERLAASGGPQSFLPPRRSFTVLLPARHEEAVIYQTIHSVWAANYPRHLLEVVVVCHGDDHGTIAEAERAIAAIGSSRIRVETFQGGPINKPRGLNVGLGRTRGDVVTIFDAEDDIDPNIFHTVNTIMLSEDVNVVQAGVQLMNFRDRWFSVHNCLEYFFWFKSRLHFHAAAGMIPLGGNTVFVRRRLLEQLGGWDEGCLTEDAEIGIRLSAMGERIRVVYDAQRVTREESPATLGQLIKQRTRWCQGFLQVLRKGAWRGLPRAGQRLLAVYTLAYPLLQAALLLLWPLMLPVALWLALPLPVTIVAFLPLYVLLLQFVATAVGARLFTREYGFRLPILMPAAMALTFLPYQWLLGLSALRAVYRELRREQSWEKTAHTGAHRPPPPPVLPEPELAREVGD